MSSQIRYLNWDGYYSLKGVCNQRRDPENNIQRAQLHLTRLGFYNGPIDGQNSDVFKDAVRHFNYFPDKPIVKEDTTYFTGPSRNDKSITKSTADTASKLKPNDEVIDVKKLDSLLVWPPAVKVLKNMYGEALAVHASRQQSDGKLTGATLNSAEFAVRIMEVPLTFDISKQFGVVKLKLNAFEETLSMLIRIYRNYDVAVTDAPFEQIVYQEVLLADDLVALPSEVPDKNKPTVGVNNDEVQSFISAKRWQSNAFFMMKEHAPYKIRCWIANHAYAFDEFAEDEKIKQWGTEEEDFRFRRGCSPKIKDTDLIDPQTNKNLVHDMQSKGQGDDAIWTTDSSAGINLIEQPCTNHDKKFHDTYASNYFKNPKPDGFVEKLMADPVKFYQETWRARYTNENFQATFLRETFEEAAKHLKRIGQSLCCGRDSKMDDDIKKQLSKTIDKADSKLLECWQGKLRYIQSVKLMASIAALSEWHTHHCRTVPEMKHYQLCDLDPEGFTWSSKLSKVLSHERNMWAENQKDEPSRYLSELITSNDKRTCDEFFEGVDNIGRSSNRLFRALEDKNIILVPSYAPLDVGFFTKTRQVPVFILGLLDIHYLNADAHRYTPWQFFNHDLFHTISNGDANPVKQYTDSPQMWHWMRDHLVEAFVSPPKPCLVIRELTHLQGGRKELINKKLEDVVVNNKKVELDGFPNDDLRLKLCKAWQKNAILLQSGRDCFLKYGAEKSENFQRAYDITLFCLLHEPMRSTKEYTRCFFPAVPDPEDLWRRLREPNIKNTIIERAEDYWFGPPSQVNSQVIAYIGLAIIKIEHIVRDDKMQYSRTIIHGGDTLSSRLPPNSDILL